jgi:hypothetical protein
MSEWKSNIPEGLDLDKKYLPAKTEYQKKHLSETSKKAHTDAEFKKNWYAKTLAAANDPARVAAISEFNKKNSKFKDPAIREKSRKIKQDNGSYISPEIAAPIYCDPEFWGKDRYYGAARKISEKYNISESRAQTIRDNGYSFEPAEKHEYWLSEWQATVAVRWCISTPGPEWLDMYDEQFENAIPPSKIFEARFNSMEPLEFLLESCPAAYSTRDTKGRKDAIRKALQYTFPFLTTQPSEKFVFYSRADAARWCMENYGQPKSFEIGIGLLFNDKKRTVFQTKKLAGFVFYKENL